MENGKTVKDLLDAADLAEGDLLIVNQPEEYNPITSKKGTTRKVRAGRFIDSLAGPLTQADQVDGLGRNLLDVLGVSTIPQAMAALRVMCNGEGTPNFARLRLGDYIDGIDLSAIPAENDGSAGQPFNATYLNNRVVIAGFNTYKSMGDTETKKNHVLFAFANIPISKRMDPTDNIGGYPESELRAFMDGRNGDGTGNYNKGSTAVTTGAFYHALNAQLGELGGYILRIRRTLIEAPLQLGTSWKWYSVFLPSESEMFGVTYYNGTDASGKTTVPYVQSLDGGRIVFPLYQKSGGLRIKRKNGNRTSYWLATPHLGSSAYRVVNGSGYCEGGLIKDAHNCSPVFCVC
jgi:hypothetical protein